MPSLTPITDPHTCGHTRVNLAGQRFGKLTAIKEAGRSERTTLYWELRCDCGQTTYAQVGNLQRGKNKTCGQCDRRAPGEAARNNRYALYKREAAARNLRFELTVEQCTELTAQPCTYCGLPPSNRHNSGQYNGDFVYNGIDRINGAEGYTLENCTPCCWDCNEAKKDTDHAYFLAWLNRITDHQNALRYVRFDT